MAPLNYSRQTEINLKEADGGVRGIGYPQMLLHSKCEVGSLGMREGKTRRFVVQQQVEITVKVNGQVVRQQVESVSGTRRARP